MKFDRKLQTCVNSLFEFWKCNFRWNINAAPSEFESNNFKCDLLIMLASLGFMMLKGFLLIANKNYDYVFWPL